MSAEVRLIKAMVFPVVMYGCESWTIKKAKRWRIDAFEAWCWRRLLSVPWTVGRSNPSILKETNPEYSLAGLMLPPDGGNTLATWCEELTHLKRPWCWERLKVGEGDDRGWDGWMASLTECTWVWVSSRSWWWTGKPWHAAVHGVAKSRTQASNWTELTAKVYFLPLVSLPSWPNDPSTLPTVTLIKHVCDHDSPLLKRLTAVCRTVFNSSAQEASPIWPWPSFSASALDIWLFTQHSYIIHPHMKLGQSGIPVSQNGKKRFFSLFPYILFCCYNVKRFA